MNQLSRRSLLTAGLALAAGCKTTTSYLARDPSASTFPAGESPLQGDPIVSVAMVGDSITEGSSSSLRRALADVGVADVVIDGEASRRIANGSGRDGHSLSGVRALGELLDDGVDPSVWVIALGTNDVGSFGTPQECVELIGEITALLPLPVRLVWVNVYRPSDLRQTRVFNEVLAGQLGARGGAVVADWYTIASDPDRDVLRGDNLHPNDDGKIAFAEVVVQALQRL